MNNINLLKSLYKKSYKMVDGRQKGGFIDHEEPVNKAIAVAISALEKTSDKKCLMCIDKGKCAIYDNFNIDYCSDWRNRNE